MKKANRFIAILMALCLLLSLVPSAGAAQHTVIIGGNPYGSDANYHHIGSLYYVVKGSNAIVTGADTDLSGAVNIASYVGGKPVTGIQSRAFRLDNITSVSLPSTLKEIGFEAFSGCKRLTHITLPEGLTTIGEAAFAGSGLVSVTIPKSVTTIRPNPFYGCKNLTSLRVAAGNAKFSAYKNSLVNHKDKILIAAGPNGEMPTNGSIKIIGNYAFAENQKLTAAYVPYGVIEIGGYAFYHCENLATVTMEDSANEIGEYCFYSCKKLKNVKLSAEMRFISGCAFTDCVSLEEIYLPRKTWGCGQSTFSRCTNLRIVGIPHKDFTLSLNTFDKAPNAKVYCRKGTLTEEKMKREGYFGGYLYRFDDVREKDWFVKNKAIDTVCDNGLFTGVTKYRFAPKDNMTRAMFVTVLGRLDGVQVKNSVKTAFTDVKKGQYYTGYVKWASENGIVNGMTKTAFGPDENISREQICAMMLRYCNFAKIKLQKKNAELKFADAAEISGYAKKAVKACQMGGVINGEKSGKGYVFRPAGNATRAEVATILTNFRAAYLLNK